MHVAGKDGPKEDVFATFKRVIREEGWTVWSHRTEGHAERYHGRLLVRFQGRAVRYNGQGGEGGVKGSLSIYGPQTHFRTKGSYSKAKAIANTLVGVRLYEWMHVKLGCRIGIDWLHIWTAWILYRSYTTA